MQQSLVEQLRDIHQPAVPAGDSLQLVLLLILLSVSTFALLHSLWRLYRPSLPLWQHRALNELDAARQLPNDESLAVAAATLRRAVSHMAPSADLSRTTGSLYLQRLDELFDCDFFSSGPGTVFGNSLYQRVVFSGNVDDAINGVSELLRQRRS